MRCRGGTHKTHYMVRKNPSEPATRLRRITKALSGQMVKSLPEVCEHVHDGALMPCVGTVPKERGEGPPLAKAWISLGQTVPT